MISRIIYRLLPATLLLASSALPALAQPARDFFMAATEAGQNEHWKAINWQPNMESAKAQASRQHKPILVVLHNNFGGDVHRTDC